jgi:hypothetical protein
MVTEESSFVTWTEWTRVFFENGLFSTSKTDIITYEGVSKSFRTGCLERELQMLELSAPRGTCIAVL